MKNLQKELEKELINKRKSEEKIKKLQSEIVNQNKKLPKDIEKLFQAALTSSRNEIEVLVADLYEKEKAFRAYQNDLEIKAAEIAEKYGVPVRYSVLDTEYCYGPESYQDKWFEYQSFLQDQFDFYSVNPGWSSSSC